MTSPDPPSEELKVFILKGRDSTCGECQQELGKVGGAGVIRRVRRATKPTAAISWLIPSR